MKTTKKISLDFTQRGFTEWITAVQGDSYTREVELSLYSDGQAWTIPDGVSVRMRYRLPDGTGDAYDALPDGSPFWTASENILTVMLAPQMLVIAGLVEAQLQIDLGDETIATFSFIVAVERDPSAGVPESQEAVSWANWTDAQLTRMVKDAIGSGGDMSTEYETVKSVEEMTDTSKQYVLSSTGTVWTYGKDAAEKVPENRFVASTATLNKRISSSGESNANGYYISDYIEFDASTANSSIIWLPTNCDLSLENQRVLYADGSKTKLASPYIRDYNGMDYLFFGKENGRYYVDLSKNTLGDVLSYYGDTKYIRIGLSTGLSTAITANDIADMEILFENDKEMATEKKWYDTGLTPSSAGGNYVDLLVTANKNASDISELSTRVATLETGSDTLTIPSFWQDAVDSCISKIKALQVGRNCITFPFFSDNHQRNGYAGMLIAYIMKECNMPFCFYGGDSISNGTIADEATMIEQDKAFDTMMSYVPNDRLCRAVGNHDGYWYDGTNRYYYNRDKIYDLFLREESIAQNKHFGGDGTYYYVDEIASKVRFIVLNTNGIRDDSGAFVGSTFDSTQLEWLLNVAMSVPDDGWAVVFISHQPISNHYHAGISNAADVVSAVVSTANTKNVPIIGWFSGHIHRDIIATKLMTGGNGSNAGTETTDLGFTQVIITSDHTGIAYDDATLHPVANDDKSHAIDFITINRTNGTVNLTRLGIGNDRSYTY